MKKRKRTAGLLRIVYMMCGAILGLAFREFILWHLPPGSTYHDVNMRSLAVVFYLVISYLGQIVVHETGHLVFGLASGYRFSSFRIGSLVLLKRDGKLLLRKYRLAGTGGQCLMAPPEMKDGKLPVIAYNLGGAILNLMVSGVFFVVFLLTDKTGYTALFYLCVIAAGLLAGLTNGIPIRSATVDNDGHNAVALTKDPEAARAFWIQLKIMELTSQGMRLKEMPEEWFRLPEEKSMNNSMMAAIAYYAYNRLVDQHRFDEARQLMEQLLSTENGMSGLLRTMLLCDKVYLELIGENRADVLAQLQTRELKRYMKAAKTSPSVIRTEYARMLLEQKDPWKAQIVMQRFEEAAESYPYPGEILLERELLATADRCSHDCETRQPEATA